MGVTDPDEAERKAIIGVTGVQQPAVTKRMTVHLAELGSDLSLVPTPWEPGRWETMCATGRVIYEKAAAGQLLTDLRDASG